MGSGKIAVITGLCLCLALTGCNGARETNDIIYIIGIGLDKKSEGMLHVTYQYTISRALAKEGNVSSKEAVDNITITAPTLAEAFSLLGTIFARIPNLSHVKMIIIGEELAKSGIGDVMASATRFREFRGSMYLLTVKNGTAKELMANMKPNIELLPSKYVESTMLTNREIGYYPRTQVLNFGMRMKRKSEAPYTALVALNPLTGRDVPSRTAENGEKVKEYTAGNIPMTGKVVPINFAGTALYRDDKLVGTLTSEETRSLLMLTGELGLAYFTVADPLAPEKVVNFRGRLREKPKITAYREEGVYRFDIFVHLEGEITSLPSGIHYEDPKMKIALEEQISAVITKNIRQMLAKTQELGCDIVALSNYTRSFYQTYPEWRKAAEGWSDNYRNADLRVTVKTTVRRAGLMWETTPIFKTPSGQ